MHNTNLFSFALRVSFVALILAFCNKGNTQDLESLGISGFAEFTQELGQVELKFTYIMSRADGDKIFEWRVPYGERWKPGVLVTFSDDIHIGSQSLLAGTYSIYIIPNKEEWIIIIHKNTRIFSIPGEYREKDEACRFTAKPIYSPTHIETLNVECTDITSSTLNISISWENQIIQLPVSLDEE